MTLIKTDDLTKKYGSVTAVSELTVDIDPGVVGLIGANGAGKSTLIKMVLGLLPWDPLESTCRHASLSIL